MFENISVVVDFLESFYPKVPFVTDMTSPILFWGVKKGSNHLPDKECLSQFYYAPFIVPYGGDNYRFATNEQFMMCMKSAVFGSSNYFNRIVNCENPALCKRMGRQVPNFDPKIWAMHDKEIVFFANFLKFTQNEKLKTFLLETGNKYLAEASPFDSKWGIGISEQTAKTMHPNRYPGSNYLGMQIMAVREAILMGENFVKQIELAAQEYFAELMRNIFPLPEDVPSIEDFM